MSCPFFFFFNSKKIDQIKIFLKTMNSSLKLGAFDHASFIFKKKRDHHHHLFIKNQDFQKSCIHF